MNTPPLELLDLGRKLMNPGELIRESLKNIKVSTEEYELPKEDL